MASIAESEAIQKRLEKLERQNRRLKFGGIFSLMALSGLLLQAQTSTDAAKFEEFNKPAEWKELERKFLMAEVRMIQDMLPAQGGMECGRVQGLSADGQRVAIRVPVVTGELPGEEAQRKEVLLRKANATARSVILEFMPRLQVKDVEIEFVDFDAGGMKTVAVYGEGEVTFP
jgi:hypothetical protein